MLLVIFTVPIQMRLNILPEHLKVGDGVHLVCNLGITWAITTSSPGVLVVVVVGTWIHG